MIRQRQAYKNFPSHEGISLCNCIPQNSALKGYPCPDISLYFRAEP